MKNKMLTALLITAVVMLTACTSTGTITEFQLSNPDSFPGSITAGPDGNLWFAECVPAPGACTSSQIGRITSGK